MTDSSKRSNGDSQFPTLDRLTVGHPELKLNGNTDNLTHHWYEHNLESLEASVLFKEETGEYLYPINYLNSIQASIPEQLISPQNYEKIKNIAKYFPGEITSFFGFETQIGNKTADSDFLFAISSKNGEREAFAELLDKDNFSELISKYPEWQRIKNFTSKWIDPSSPLNRKILGLWFEFDTSNSIMNDPLPNIFFHPESIKSADDKKISEYKWITRDAIPLITGKTIQDNVEKKIIECIKKLPGESAIFQIGMMMSRSPEEIRLVVKRIKSNEVVPYLKDIGYNKDLSEIASFLYKLDEYINRIVLHFTVGKSVHQKIGIEISFYPDMYHQELGWNKVLEYLVENGLCLPEKQQALLQFPGVENDDKFEGFNMYIPKAKIVNPNSTEILVRYLSHIKILYEPGKKLKAKAYSGVRSFTHPEKQETFQSKMKVQ